MGIPLVDLKAQNQSVRCEILKKWSHILESADFIGTNYITTFEKDFANACETQECVAVGSGTDALRFILIALGLQSGDEVITVPNTFIATIEAIVQTNATVRFVDIDRKTGNMNPYVLEAAITQRTKCIIPVHLYGNPADMDPILSIAKKYGIHVVEDASQAHLAEYKGRKIGSLGIAAGFSFYPSKNLGACGQAGAVTTNDTSLAQKIRMISNHGQKQKYYHQVIGYSGRCDALQAAALSVKLKYLSEWNQKRRNHALTYVKMLEDYDEIQVLATTENSLAVYHLFIVELKNRDKAQQYLAKNGIETGLHYPIPVHLQKACKNLKFSIGSFPIAEKASNKILSLPIFPELTQESIKFVVDKLKEFFDKKNR